MHPEVTSDKLVDCTKCGMHLEKTTQGISYPSHSSIRYHIIRKIAYLDKDNGQYVGKEVTLGPKARDITPFEKVLKKAIKLSHRPTS